jgi:dTDP-4-amino-4,6-dideoxygalactose transaminase
MAGSHGRLGCFSFYPTKNLGALGDAGAIVTGDRDVAAKLRALRTYGWGAKYHCTLEGGMNSRMDELQAAALRAKLPRLDGWNRRRREIAARYAATIRHPGIILPPPIADESGVAHLYVVRAKERESLRVHLAQAGVATDIHYPVPDHRQPGAGRTPPQGLPHTERACEEVLSLPCYPELTPAEIDAVAAACNRWQPATRS